MKIVNHHTGCPQKNFILLWKAIAPLKIIVGIKVGGVSESAGADLSVEYHHFSVAQQGEEIFEFKVDPVPKITLASKLCFLFILAKNIHLQLHKV